MTEHRASEKRRTSEERRSSEEKRPSEEKRISDDQIDQANSDIVSVVQQFVSLKKAGKNWHACCPFHNEKTPSFTVSESGGKDGHGFFYCFGCGASGNAIGFVMDHLGIGFRDAVERINGRLDLSSSGSVAPIPAKPRAIRCDLPGHAEDAEKTARVLCKCKHVEQHPYLLRNNVAPRGDVLEHKGALIVPLINNLGETVNAAAVSARGITFAAGNPSFGSTAIIEPANGDDGRIIICADYAHAWRIWWAQQGKSRVLCTMDAGNLNWMLASCRDRFTHVGCDIADADEYAEYGHQVVAVPVHPYSRLSPRE